jgi:predicted nucleic acid-binding protein
MPEDVERQYWDSCMFISLLSKHPQRLDAVKELLEQERRELIQVVCSTLVIAEVRPIINSSRSNKKQIDAVFEMLESGRIEYRPVTQSIGTEAQKLGIKHSELSPGDCVHIATAMATDVAVLFTFDGVTVNPAKRTPSKMLYHDEKLMWEPRTTPLRIKPPYVSRGILFDSAEEQQPAAAKTTPTEETIKKP